MQKIKNLIQGNNPKQSKIDKKMYRRSFEKHLDQVKMPHHYTGFTNRILVQQPDDKSINYFIPVYVIFKIKSIQEIDIQKLSGSISCVIIINVQIQNLPDPIVYLLETGMNIQLNRSELVQLKESQQHNISVSKKDKLLSFTIRKTVTGTIVEDTLWSPFEIIRLIVSITFNSIKKDGEEITYAYLEKQAQQKRLSSSRVENIIKQLGGVYAPKTVSSTKKKSKNVDIDFDSLKKYNISFNCMRNGSYIPISYALGCVYSLYDLAQRKLQTYHTQLDSYNQIIRKYQDQQQSAKQQKKEEQKQKKVGQHLLQANESSSQFEIEHQVASNMIGQYLQEIYTKSDENKKKKGLPKPKYYQFTHFVIPLYKYPGNSLATIFIPIFLLALLSLAIFYQDNQLSSRIGSIATMVLGYIALIPSIKQQLPPSSKITIIESVIYLSTLCCLLSLIQSFRVNGIQNYVFQWADNSLFLLCLIIHLSIFIFILSLLVIHKFVWEKSYNYDSQVKSPDPQNEKDSWINLYCDEQFFKVNDKIYKMNSQDPVGLIKKYQPRFKNETGKQHEKANEKQSKGFLSALLMDPAKPSQKAEDKQGIIKQQKQQEIKVQQLPSILKSDNSTVAEPSLLASKTDHLLVSKVEKGHSKQSKGQSQNKKGEKVKLKHHKSLQQLDNLLKKGKHISIASKKQKHLEKAKSESVDKKAKQQSSSKKKNK